MRKSNLQRTILLESIRLLLRPVIRYTIRHSLSIHDFYAMAKIGFLEIAEEEIRKTEDKVNFSRLSILTGMHRRDVKNASLAREAPPEEPKSILSRLIGQWEQDRRFTNKAKQPRVLSYMGEDSEFNRLVESVSKHINSGAVMFELLRNGAVERTPRGLKLLQRGDIAGTDQLKGFDILSRDIDTLITAVEENIVEPKALANLHIRTEYDNLYLRHLPQVRKWMLKEGRAFHKKARTFLARLDKEVSPSSGATAPAGGKVVLQAFSLTTSLGPNKDDSPDAD